MEKVLIVGANGLTGKILVERLKKGNYEPVAMIRNPAQAGFFTDQKIEVKLADLEDDLEGVCDDIDKIIFAAGSGSSTGKDKTTTVDQEGAIRLMDEAKKANVKKFVMLSAIRADHPDDSPIQHYLKAKKAADDHLREIDINYSIIRPGRLTKGEGSGHIIAKEHLGSQNGAISREDVAQVLVSALDHVNLHNKTIEVLEGEETIEEALANLSN